MRPAHRLLVGVAAVIVSCSESKPTRLPPPLPVFIPAVAPAEPPPEPPEQAPSAAKSPPRSPASGRAKPTSKAPAASASSTRSPAAKGAAPARSAATKPAPPSTPSSPPPRAERTPSTPTPTKRVSIPSTPHVRAEVPDGLQRDLDADPRMQGWLEKVFAVIDGCHAKNRAATGTIEAQITMHENERPDADIRALPPALSSVVACATGGLMRTKMPLFTGREGTRYAIRIRFQ